MPRAKKVAGTAADPRNGQRALTVVGGGKVERLPAPRGLSKPAKAAWEAFWDDRPAALMTPAATVVLLRWVDALDRYLRTTAEADKNPLVTGSQNQEVMNPLYRIAEQALSTVTTCEKQLGIGGLNASQLGLAAITEARSLQDMNARYSDDDDSEDEEEEPDPRLHVIEGDAI
ncbi:P27 family phage terminase small subunit [Streptosporangium canum]|uniref:P27 family phage terminase small subunit n=1 Tax=Streptosporangium canum TaxID=324952 RepID=UPI00378C7E68